MQVAHLALKRQLAMLDFEEGRIPDAQTALDGIIQDFRNLDDANARYDECLTLIDRATVLRYSHRWHEAIDDLNACADLAQRLPLQASRAILAGVYNIRAKLYATSLSPIFKPEAAHEDLSRLQALDFSNLAAAELAADLAYQEGDWDIAAQNYRLVEKAFSDQGMKRAAMAVKLRVGHSLLEQGDLAEAEPEIETAQAFFERYGPPDLFAKAQIHAARLWLKKGEPEIAWELAQSALERVESAIRKFHALFDQQRFVLDKLTYYQYAFEIGLARGGTQGILLAWTIAERAKSFYLCQLMANADIRFFDGVDSSEIDQLDELERQLDECEAELGRLKDTGSNPERQEQLNPQLRQLSETKMKLVEKMRRENPRLAGMRIPPAFDMEAELKKLDPAWIPLSYFWQSKAEGATLHIFYTGKDREPQHIMVAWSLAELEQLDDSRRRLRGKLKAMAKIFPDNLVERVLPSAIIEALEPGQRLLISPHGRLRAIPLHVLPNRHGEPLIDNSPVQYIPTLALLPLQKPVARSSGVLLMGCIKDGFGHNSLEDVQAELDTLNQLWSAKRPGQVTSRLIPTDGSPVQFGLPPTKWGDFEFLHIACHGEFPEERPLDAALYLGKEALRVSEFFAAPLNAKLVSLSACSLGSQTQHHFGVDLAGDEWLGLYLPLFYAGAQTLLVSLWEANSEQAVPIMKALHTALVQEVSPAEAFQQAIKSVKHDPKPFWANWYLVGFPENL